MAGGKKGKKKQQDDFEYADEILNEEETTAAVSVDVNDAPKTANADKDATNSNNNNSNNVDGDDTLDSPPVVEIKIKSKKEKERERKERQKQQQKLKQQQQQSNKPNNKGREDSVDDSNVDESRPESPVVAQAAENDQDQAAQSSKSGGKKKKGGPSVAALKELLAAKKAEEERLRLEQEREEQLQREKLAELERLEREQEEKARLRKEKKKEKERLKKEQLRKEGKLLSDAALKKQKRDQEKLGQMLEAGQIVVAAIKQDGDDAADEDGDGASTQQQKKKVVYDNKKKGKQNKNAQQEDQLKANVDNLEVQEDQVDAGEGKEQESPEVAEDWEEIADSWEELDEEEDKDDQAENGDKWDEEDGESSGDEEESAKSPVEAISQKMKNLDIQAKGGQSSLNGSQLSSPVADADSDSKKSKKPAQQGDLRSPICVILGHVDTGKTKLLDKIRQTNVQEGEAGGITQQIGATYFPADALADKTKVVRESKIYGDINPKSGFSQNFEFKIPALLLIDTPGHESFTNLRSRGSSLCNIAILVVDIMHGLEPQTIESINLLKQRKTPFIVALNKIDRIYGWKEVANNSFLDSFQAQSKSVKKEFDDRLQQTKVAFAEQGLNAEVFYKNPDVRKFVSLVPTSAITGEGIPDLISLLVQLTQNRLTERLMYLSSLEATVLEVKVIEGLGTTIDVILSNGIIREGDRIVICGLNGAIATNIRALLTPQPMRELRVKSAYVHHKEIKAAMGVKISAPDLDKAIAGSRLLVVRDGDDEEQMKLDVMSDLTNLFESVDKSGRGVCVQASTLGSLEALLSFLKDSKIPVSIINIGPIHKKDVMKCSVMLEHAKEYAVILAFDVKIDRDAQELAEEMGIKVFKADIIYHLFDQFTAYNKKLIEDRKKEMAAEAIWPCHLKIVPGCVFNKRDPIILGVDIVEGQLRLGTPICVPSKECVVLGKVAGIEKEHKAVEQASKGSQVAVRIETDQVRIFGRHFEENDELVSRITRKSIDILKEAFRSEVSKDEWLLIKKLKPILKID
ncbi:hypothetical protein MP228_006150 [Amoeboaphelidium protococcarum]|nr:hypothetical protein MP228_006150 [Amoeboaphelidium protococcarum]